MNNLHLFELIYAGPGLGPAVPKLTVALAQWLVYSIPRSWRWLGFAVTRSLVANC